MQLLREIRILRHCRGHDNIIELSDVLLEPASKSFRYVFIITVSITIVFVLCARFRLLWELRTRKERGSLVLGLRVSQGHKNMPRCCFSLCLHDDLCDWSDYVPCTCAPSMWILTPRRYIKPILANKDRGIAQRLNTSMMHAYPLYWCVLLNGAHEKV